MGMGFLTRLLRNEPLTPALVERPTFSVDTESIPPGFYGLVSYSSPVAPAGRVDRATAMQVPAVKRSRDLIAGTLGALPVVMTGPDRSVSSSALLEQPEPDVPRSVTLTRTYADMLLEGVAWWRVLEFGWHSYPVKVRRLEPRSVNVTKDGRVYITKAGHYGTAHEWVTDAELIRFDSPNEPLLVAGARAIRTAAMLDAAAQRMSDGTPPVDYFTPADGAPDPADDDEIVELLDDWQTARQTRSTAYVPSGLRYNQTGFNPEQLQMAEARQHAVLEIARAAGVDPEDVGVSTTSRTYFNAFDKRKQFTDFTLGAYRTAFEHRLSMGDVTPRGYSVQVNLDDFLRSDALTRYQAYQAGLAAGALLPEEVRQMEGRPPITPTPQSAPSPSATSQGAAS